MILARDDQTARIRGTALQVAAILGCISFVYSCFQGRPVAHALAIAIAVFLAGLGPWCVYHYKSGRNDGLIMVGLTSNSAFRSSSESAAGVLISLVLSALIYLFFAFLFGTMMKSKLKVSPIGNKPLWDAEVDGPR